MEDQNEELFVVVTWPASQTLMEKEWFDECYLINDDRGLEVYGSSAYFVPLSRYQILGN